MKKKLFYFFLSFVLISNSSCSYQDSIESSVSFDKTGFCCKIKNHRSIEEVLKIAETAITYFYDGDLSTRAGNNNRRLNLYDGIKAIYATTTRSTESDTLLYVINFENNQGFAVVSALHNTEGLIAVADTGYYDPAEPTDNPSFDFFMDLAKQYVINGNIDATDEIEFSNSTTSATYGYMFKPVYDTIYYNKIEPRITVRWGQDGQMGQFCPNGLSGCSITASAQIMSYFRYPNMINLTYSLPLSSRIFLNWTAMGNRIYTHEISDMSSNTDNVGIMIGRLARELGHRSHSVYINNDHLLSTETFFDDIRSTLSNLGYTVGNITNYNYMLTENVENPDAGYILANHLKDGKLILMGGFNFDDLGHTWVIDGCFYVKALYRLMRSEDGGNSWTIDREMGTYRTCHNHINWGYDGLFNGYFLSNVFNARNYVQLDPEHYNYSGDDNLNYRYNIKYFTVKH